MKYDINGVLESIKSTFAKGGTDTAAKANEIKDKVGNAAEGLAKEAEEGPQIHEQAIAALQRMQEMNSSVKEAVGKAYGYAVFPSAARASLIVGVTYGKGEVFEKGNVIGYAGIIQITGGVQVGGETLHVLVLMDNDKALERFKSGKVSFAASASLAMVKAGVIAGKSPEGLRVIMFSEGGEMLEAAIGGQTFKFRPAAIGRLRQAG